MDEDSNDEFEEALAQPAAAPTRVGIWVTERETRSTARPKLLKIYVKIL